MIRNALALLLAVASGACITPSVVDSSGRAVELAQPSLSWSPARSEDLVGLFESVAIEGDAALSLWRVHYHFARDPDADEGSYSGAALVLGGATPQFQTLSGRWTRVDGHLEFDDGSSARVFVAGEFLRLESDGGVVVLRRAAVQ